MIHYYKDDLIYLASSFLYLNAEITQLFTFILSISVIIVLNFISSTCGFSNV